MSNEAPTDALRLVPVEPTSAMIQEGLAVYWKTGDDMGSIKSAYAAMLAAAPASPLPGDGWQDISTAPKDGRNILAWGYLHDDGGPYETDGRSFMGETPHEMVVYFSPEFGIWRDRSDGGSYAGLTHWMPLPSPPIEVQK